MNVDYSVTAIYTNTSSAVIDNDKTAANGEAPYDVIKTVQDKKELIKTFDKFLEIMNMMIILLVAVGVALGIVVLYNLGTMSYAERYREMATLKVVGFRDKKIGRLLIEQNLWVTVFGMVVGLPLGIFTLDYLIKALASEYEMNLVLGPLTFISGIVITLGVSLFVGFMIARKNKKINMVESLKAE